MKNYRKIYNSIINPLVSGTVFSDLISAYAD